MWIEIEVLLKDKIVNWQDLGFEIKHDFARRMVKLEEVYYLQELLHDIQVMYFHDATSVYVRGDYEELRDKILHLTEENESDL